MLTLNAEPYTVVGVAPRGVAFPRGPEMPSDFHFAAAPDVWIPLEPPRNGVADLAIVGRLRDGMTTTAAGQDMDRVMAVVQRTIPVIKNSRPREWLVPFRQQVVGDVTPMLAGRDFSSDDRTNSPPVVIVNDAMAKWLWPGERAIGKRIRIGRPLEQPMWPWMTVVGVVADMKRYSLTETPHPEMILPYTQDPYLTFSTMQFVVRSRLESPALLRQVQGAIAAADPTIPIANVRTVSDLVSESASNARFVASFMAGFGVVALLLTVVGVYGVIGYGVQRRRQEFGVRRALGAGTREILALILREAFQLTGAGIAVGLTLTLGAGFGLRHLLYGISPFDPVSLAGAIAVIGAATVAASVIPARAAARVQPRAALED